MHLKKAAVVSALATAALGFGGLSMAATASAGTVAGARSTVSPNAWYYSGRWFYSQYQCQTDGQDAVNERLAIRYSCNYEWNNAAGGPVWDEYRYQS